MNAADFRRRLREARTAAGLSQAELALRAEISERAIQYIERGRYLPYLHTADKLAGVLGVSLDWLARGEEAQSPSG